MTHLYPFSEPKSERKKSDNDPKFVTYNELFIGLSSNADINGVPRPVFTRQTCM